MLSLILFVFALFALYKYLVWNFDYWEKRGVIGPKPQPFVGTFPRSSVYLKNFVYELDDIYRKYAGKTSIVGVFTHRTPELLILDAKLVDEILVSKFKYFHANSTNYNKTNAALFVRNPFILKNEEWKENRADISPAFTTLKTKSTYPVIEIMCSRLTKYIKSKIEQGGPMSDTKEITAKFTADVICTVAYGLEAGALTEKHSEFLEMSAKLFETSWIKLLFITFKSVFPSLLQFYELPFVPETITNYFVGLTKQAIQLRESNEDYKRDDYLNFLLKLREKKGDLEVEDMAAHMTTFFLDAYETSSIILTHALYQLAKNKYSQKKLRDEIERCNEDFNFEIISGLKYLDQVFKEVMRISTPGFGITKVCMEDTELLNVDGKPVMIEKGTNIHIPIYSIHNDPRYYHNPNVFNPERFDEELCPDAKALRDKGVFFPFGSGPRICLGMRYSTLLIKSAIVEIVRNFEISVNPKTVVPIIIHPKDYLYLAVHNIYLDYKLIK